MISVEARDDGVEAVVDPKELAAAPLPPPPQSMLALPAASVAAPALAAPPPSLPASSSLGSSCCDAIAASTSLWSSRSSPAIAAMRSTPCMPGEALDAPA